MTQTVPGGAPPALPRLVVPAYFHPVTHAREWALLAEQGPRIRLVVLNLANGPGARPDQAFLAALAGLRAAGVEVAGYVDTGYGHRPPGEALDELGRYLDWYDVAGVTFDQVSATADHVGHYAGLARRARAMGARVVVFNHGIHPVEAYAEHADLLGTFEGPWLAYRDAVPPRWTRGRPARQFYHLVYSVPPGHFDDAYRLAAARNAGCAYITDHGGANPWKCLPTGLCGPRKAKNPP